MAKKGFYIWLKKQNMRQDRVGDLARDAIKDDSFPKNMNTLKRLEAYLESKNAYSSAIETMQIAWKEFNYK